MKQTLFPLGLSGLLLLAACQPEQALTTQSAPFIALTEQHSPIAIKAPSIKRPGLARVQYHPKPVPFGRVNALGDQKLRVNFTYPDPQHPQKSFQTQAFSCDEVAFAQIAVSGAGLPQTLYADGSDAVHHMFAANQCNISGTLSNIPYGDLVLTIKVFDANRTYLAGSKLIGGLRLDEASESIELSYRQKNTGQVLETLISGSIEDEFLAGQLDLEALQSFFDTLTGLGGTYPTYTFTTDPALINIDAIVTDLKANGGDITALNPSAPTYIHSPGSVQFQLNGVLTGQNVEVSVDDALSTDATVSTNGLVTINNLPPGNWSIRLSGPGYLPHASIPITIVAGQQTSQSPLTLLSPPPVLNSITPTQGVSGQSITLAGSDFNLTPANNTVKFGSTIATVTAASANSLTVTVPNGLPLATTSVSVAIGSESPAPGVNFEVVKPTLSNLSPSNGVIGSSVTLTGTHFNPTAADNTVKFGNTPAIVTAASANSLTVTVPSGLT